MRSTISMPLLLAMTFAGLEPFPPGASLGQEVSARGASDAPRVISGLSSASDEDQWGTFRGRVILDGRDPPRQVITPWKDREFFAQRKSPITSERLLVDPETGGIANALVYLVDPTTVRDSARRATPKAVQFEADRGVFVPHVLAAMTGTEIIVSTKDPVTYNLDVRIPIASGIVSSGVLAGGSPPTETQLPAANRLNVAFGGFPFKDARWSSASFLPRGIGTPTRGYNAIHNWMSAWWLILDHPYFAVTDQQGRFTIRDVPAGGQQVIVWHESLNPKEPWPGARPRNLFEGKVEIRGGSENFKIFVLEAGKIRKD